ncbi:MAG: hypothetical protein LBJ87_14910, partial [bacterium]|nr:hypothetical protein [bacterium]
MPIDGGSDTGNAWSPDRSRPRSAEDPATAWNLEGAMGSQYRAEHVGSLLRPPELLQARRDHEEGRIDLDQLRAAEDRAALANLDLQRETGMEVYTDGEARGANWMADLMGSLGGLTPLQGVPTGEG